MICNMGSASSSQTPGRKSSSAVSKVSGLRWLAYGLARRLGLPAWTATSPTRAPCPLSPAVRIRRVCPTLSPFFAGASEECNEPHQKTNGTAPKRRGPERDLYMVELILKGSGLLRTAAHDPRHALRVFYCSLFAIAWSISLSSAARCSAELMAPTMGSPTMLPFRSIT